MPQQPPRLRNYFIARNHTRESEEVPWMHVPGLSALTLPRPVVVVNGAFDVLHSGHMRVIFAARERCEGGTLVCALDSDERVRSAKGPTRPIQSYIERATTLGYMPLDYIVEITSDADMKILLHALRPDLRVQGYDYHTRPSKFPNIRKMYVRSSGMRTSTIEHRILTSHKEHPNA